MRLAFRSLFLAATMLFSSADLRAQEDRSSPDATEPLSSSAEQSPELMAQTHFAQGARHMRDKKFASAAQAFERATLARPNFGEAYNNWGIALVQLGRQSMSLEQQAQHYQLATEKFAKAAELLPNEKLTYILWSETLVLLGDLPMDGATRLACYQAAVEKSRKAVEIAPDDWESYNKWAVILTTKLADFTVNQQARFLLFKEAADLFGKASEHVRFSGELGPVYANWAGTLVHAARAAPDAEQKMALLREALPKFERSVRAYPKASSTYAMWGTALIELGKISRSRNDFRDAIDKLNTSLSINPNDAGTQYNLACAYALMDNPLMAIQSLKKSFALDSNKVYRNSAAQDPDLTNLHTNQDFVELVSPGARRSAPAFNPPLRDRPR